MCIYVRKICVKCSFNEITLQHLYSMDPLLICQGQCPRTIMARDYGWCDRCERERQRLLEEEASKKRMREKMSDDKRNGDSA